MSKWWKTRSKHYCQIKKCDIAFVEIIFIINEKSWTTGCQNKLRKVGQYSTIFQNLKHINKPFAENLNSVYNQ